MTLKNTLGQHMTRRTILAVFASSGASLVVAACRRESVESDDEQALAVESEDDDGEEDTGSQRDDSEGDDSEDEDLESDDNPDDDTDTVDSPDNDDDAETVEDAGDEEGDDSDDDQADEVEDEEAEVIVGDVIDFNLAPDGRWDGPFGSVTMRLHRAWVDGEDVTYIRTDASDDGFASQEGLVYVPLLANSLDEPGSYSDLYLISGGSSDQLPVMSSSPADGERFSSAFRVRNVLVTGKVSTPFYSAQEILDAADHDTVMIEDTEIVVNYPVITWPGGQIPVDENKVEALGGGQLIEDPDIDGGEVTLKLHQCYPGSRYIITDTSALPMAPMMGAGEAGGSQLLVEVGAVAPITVFLNGLDGTGAMGFQPGVFNTNAGDPAWSPFWEHFAAEWVSDEDAVPVTSQAQLDELVAAGDLTLYGGVPDTDPDTFVVNCPVPILAPVTWQSPG